MKIKISAEFFASVLDRMGTLKPNSNGEVSKHVYLEAKTGMLKVQKTDLSSYLSKTFAVEDITEKGRMLVPFDLLNRFVKMNEGDLLLYTEGKKLYVTGSAGKTRFECLDIDTYPLPPSPSEYGEPTMVPSEVISKVIECDKFVAKKGYSNLGVYMGPRGIEAMDGLRLITCKVGVALPEMVLVPSLLRGLGLSNETVAIYPILNPSGETKSLAIQDGDVELICRILDSEFRDLSVITNFTGKSVVVFNSESFLKVAKDIRAMSDVVDKRMKMVVDQGIASFFAKTSTSETKMVLDVESIDGEPSFSVAMNCGFLVDALEAMDVAELVSMHYQSGKQAVKFTTPDGATVCAVVPINNIK